jgi:cellulose biosynthesis protein BcsQ
MSSKRQEPNMKTVAVISQKGGSGKSTLSIHLATEPARAGGKALLIDLDPQGNAVRWAGRRGEELPPDVSAESPGVNRERADRCGTGWLRYRVLRHGTER